MSPVQTQDQPHPRMTFDWKSVSGGECWYTMSPTYDVLMGVESTAHDTRILLARTPPNGVPEVRILRDIGALGLSPSHLVFPSVNSRGDWALGVVTKEDVFSLYMGDLNGNILHTSGVPFQKGWHLRQVFTLYLGPDRKSVV